jgi:hypothetical protein
MLCSAVLFVLFDDFIDAWRIKLNFFHRRNEQRFLKIGAFPCNKWTYLEGGGGHHRNVGFYEHHSYLLKGF